MLFTHLQIAGLFVLLAHVGGMHVALNQAETPVRLDLQGADTLAIDLPDALLPALSSNPDPLRQGQVFEMANGQWTQARFIAPNPELEVRAPGLGS